MSEKLLPRRNTMKYKSSLFFIILLILGSAIFLLDTGYIFKGDQIVVDEKNFFPVSLKIISTEINKEFKLKNVNKQKTVFDITKDNVEIKYNNNYDFGVFIESISGIKNGDNGKYWQYYVNGKLGEVAADKKNLNSGDEVQWIFEKVPEL